MSYQQFKPGVTTFRRFAKRETNPRKWTFVREWENAPSSPTPMTVTKVNSNAVVVTSPIPQLHSPGSSSNQSFSNIVSQCRMPVLIGAGESQTKDDSDADDNHEEDLDTSETHPEPTQQQSKVQDLQDSQNRNHSNKFQPSSYHQSPISKSQDDLDHGHPDVSYDPHPHSSPDQLRTRPDRSTTPKLSAKIKEQRSKMMEYSISPQKNYSTRLHDSPHHRHSAKLRNSPYRSPAAKLQQSPSHSDLTSYADSPGQNSQVQANHSVHQSHEPMSQISKRPISPESGNSSTLAVDGDVVDESGPEEEEAEEEEEQENLMKSSRRGSPRLSAKTLQRRSDLVGTSNSKRKRLSEVNDGSVEKETTDPVTEDAPLPVEKKMEKSAAVKNTRKLPRQSVIDDSHHITMMSPLSQKKKQPKINSNIVETPTSRKSPQGTPPDRQKKRRKTQSSPVCTITQWTGHSQTRTKSNVLDLDIVLDCVTTTLGNSWKNCESREGQKALKKLLKNITSQIIDTIDKIESLKTAKSDNVKTKSEIKDLRKRLLMLQQKKMRLSGDAEKAEKQMRRQSISKWIFGFQKFLRRVAAEEQ